MLYPKLPLLVEVHRRVRGAERPVLVPALGVATHKVRARVGEQRRRAPRARTHVWLAQGALGGVHLRLDGARVDVVAVQQLLDAVDRLVDLGARLGPHHHVGGAHEGAAAQLPDVEVVHLPQGTVYHTVEG